MTSLYWPEKLSNRNDETEKSMHGFMLQLYFIIHEYKNLNINKILEVIRVDKAKENSVDVIFEPCE